MTEEDIQSELAVIHSQMAYVMQLQGRTDEALQLYNQVIKLKWVGGIIASNLVSKKMMGMHLDSSEASRGRH